MWGLWFGFARGGGNGGQWGSQNTLGEGEELDGELTIKIGKNGKGLWRSVLDYRFDSFATLYCIFLILFDKLLI
jgi:hypothetical protein